MRVAVVSSEPAAPAHSGGRIHVRNLLGGLVEIGVDVTLVTVDQDAPAGADDPWPTVFVPTVDPRWHRALRAGAAAVVRGRHDPYARTRRGDLRAAFDAALARLDPDVCVFIHSHFHWRQPRPSVLFAANVETHRLARAHGGTLPRALRHVARIERQAFADADVVVVLSEADAARAAALCGRDDIVVVPLGVATTRPARERQPATVRRVGFIGAFEWGPNQEAAEALAGLCERLRDVGVEEIRIVGRRAARHLPHLEGVGLVIHSDVDDGEAALADLDVMVVPLVNGGGVRVKILEAFALGVPVVSTRVGAEGIVATAGVELVVVESPAEVPAAVAGLADVACREALARAARACWSDRYRPRAAAERLLPALDRAVAAR